MNTLDKFAEVKPHYKDSHTTMNAVVGSRLDPSLLEYMPEYLSWPSTSGKSLSFTKEEAVFLKELLELLDDYWVPGHSGNAYVGGFPHKINELVREFGHPRVGKNRGFLQSRFGWLIEEFEEEEEEEE